MDIEKICEAVHKAYCSERIRQGKEPYWTNGDYSLLDEPTKEYDRATVKAVLKAFKEPQLGCATTEELLDEIRARIALDCKLDYRTIDAD